jgi:hypothetical protein
VLEEVVDPTMLGGFVVESGSMVFALMRHRLASGEEARRKVLPVALSMLGLSTMLLGNWWTPMAVPVCQIGAGSCARTWLSWRWRTAMVKCATCKRELTAVVRENVSGDSNLRFAIRPRGGGLRGEVREPLERQAGQTHLTGGSRWGCHRTFRATGVNFSTGVQWGLVFGRRARKGGSTLKFE